MSCDERRCNGKAVLQVRPTSNDAKCDVLFENCTCTSFRFVRKAASANDAKVQLHTKMKKQDGIAKK